MTAPTSSWCCGPQRKWFSPRKKSTDRMAFRRSRTAHPHRRVVVPHRLRLPAEAQAGRTGGVGDSVGRAGSASQVFPVRGLQTLGAAPAGTGRCPPAEPVYDEAAGNEVASPVVAMRSPDGSPGPTGSTAVIVSLVHRGGRLRPLARQMGSWVPRWRATVGTRRPRSGRGFRRAGAEAVGDRVEFDVTSPVAALGRGNQPSIAVADVPQWPLLRPPRRSAPNRSTWRWSGAVRQPDITAFP